MLLSLSVDPAEALDKYKKSVSAGAMPLDAAKDVLEIQGAAPCPSGEHPCQGCFF